MSDEIDISILKESLLKIRKLEDKLSSFFEPIAIIGMGCRLPGNVNSPEEFWKLLIDNKDAIIDIPKNRWDIESYYDADKEAPGKMYVKKGGFLQTPIDEFDAELFRISPREAEDMDPQQRLALEVAFEAIKNAGIQPSDLMHSPTGVYMGVCFNDYGHLITQSGQTEAVDNYYSTGNHYSVISGRIAYFFGLQGPAISLDTACSSSLVTLDIAVRDLRSKRCSLALAGGVSLMLSPEPTINFCKSGMLSPAEQCKTFDASADGYVRGEGCGILVLKRLSDALKDKDIILGIIRGSAVNQDGASSGLTVPNGLAQEQVIRSALDNANIPASEITYVEAHGTGTSLGDPIELQALKKTYAKDRKKNQPLFVGSVKTNIGHTEAVAGVASVIKVVLSLLHEKIPATLHFQKLNPNIDLSDTTIEIASKNREWTREAKRIAGISSFGFSGTNAHVIIEEGPKLNEEELSKYLERTREAPGFDRQRYWAEAALPHFGKRLKSVHPLLGEKLTTPDDEIIYRGQLHLGALPYLKDHQVYDHIVYPGAGYLEMMLAAAQYGLGVGIIHLINVSIEAALSFDAGKSIETEIIMKSRENGYEVAIYTQASDASAKNAWHSHAKGMVRVTEFSGAHESLNIDALKLRCEKILSQTDFYAYVNSTGISYGEHFQALKNIYVGKQEALGELKLSDDSKGYFAHPALLDGVLQLIAASLWSEKSSDLYLPIACDAMEFYAPLGDSILVHWQETESTEMGKLGNFSLCTPAGKILATIKGMHYRKASEKALKEMLAHENGVEDWFYEWSWEEKSLDPVSLPDPLGHWLILSDDQVSDELVKLFENKGAKLRCISKLDHPKTKKAFLELLKSENFDGILHVSSTRNFLPLTAENIKQAQFLGIKSLLHLTQALIDLEGMKIPLFLVTQNISAGNVSQSPLNGFYKTVLLEHPELPIKLIDLHSEWEPASFFQVLFTKSHEPIIAVNKKQLLVPRFLKIKNIRQSGDEVDFENGIKNNATYLITGGLGGLGLALAKYLIEKGATNLVLTSRRPLDAEIQESLKNLETVNTLVTYEALDVGDEKSVSLLLDRLRKNENPLKGIFHLAGVLNDAPLTEQNWNHFETVFRPKVYGSFYLHQYSENLDFFVMFSSIASSLGNPGQSNYAAANAFMDTLCEYRKMQGLPAHSISWGPWAEVGMAKDLVSRYSQMGLLGLKAKEALRALDVALFLNKAHITIANIHWKNYLKQMIEVPSWLEAFASEKISKNSWLAHFNAAGSTERATLLKTYITDTLKGILGLAASQAIDEKKGFFDMGLDSLMAVELKNRLQAGLGKSAILSTTAVFDYASVEKMTQHLAGLLNIESIQIKKREKRITPVRGDEPIAIIGMGCRYPKGANNPEDFWRLLEEGVDGISEVPSERFDIDQYYDPGFDVPGKMYTRSGGFLNVPVDLFDADFFGISPKEAEDLDPQQRLLLEVTWETLENAGIAPETLEGSDTGLYVGMMYSDYSQLIIDGKGVEGMSAYFGSGNAFSAAVGRVSFCLGLQGPCLAIDTACSSSLVAINSACESLRLGQCEQALAGGVTLMLAPGSFISACQAHMLSADGHCKTFDESADGYARAEGCGMILLKRLSDAERDGDKIYALIRSSGVNQGGATSGLTVPNGKAQEDLLRHVYSEVGLKPDDIDYVEAHGTGTSLGDPIEVRAIGAAYGDRDSERPLFLGSAKSNIGHTESAAGVAGVIKTVLALNHEILPANLNFKKLNPNIELNFPVKILTERTPWKKGDRLRRAGVSSFGFSGVNAHVIIEEAPKIEPRVSEGKERPLHILTLSAKTEAALTELIKNYQVFLNNTSASLTDICYTANTGRNHENFRMAVTAKDLEELKSKIKSGKFYKGKSVKKGVYEISEDISALAQAYTEGAIIDWEKFYAPFTKEKVSLPTYPFQRQRYWSEAAVPHFGKKLRSVHPLLGEKLTSADDEIIFRGELHLSALPYLKDHQVYGHIIYPGAGYLEMMLAAGVYGLGEGRIHLSQVSIEAALSFDEGKSIETQVIMKSTEAGFELAIYRQAQEASTENASWHCHAKGMLSISELSDGAPLDISAIKSRCKKIITQKEFYDHVNSTGIFYGEHFQALKTIYVSEEEALGELLLSDSAKAYLAHPALLDGALQLLAVSLWEENSKDLYLPVGCDAVEFYAPLGASVLAYWQETEKTEMGRSGDLSFSTVDGKILAIIKGMHYRKTTEHALRQMLAHESSIEDWLYEWNWERKSLESISISDSLGHWLVLNDGLLSEEFVKLFENKGASIRLISIADHPKNKDAFIELLKSENFSGILHMLSVGAEEALSGQEISKAQHLGTESVLHLTQALLELEETRKIPLFLITRGVVAFKSWDKDYGVLHSTLLGLFKTILTERSELPLRLIDLDSDFDPNLLFQSIFTKEDETLLALRNHRSYVPRFLKSRDAKIKRQELIRPVDDQFRLQSRQKGLLQNLFLGPLELKENLGPHEVEVEVRAVGLNFRDVLDALGLYPGEPGPLGGDASGIVTRVGASVKDLKSGDAILGMISGSLARRAHAHRDNITLKPEILDFENAAALPTVFLTAYYAFTRSTVLKKGETVLIHAGAGGVGQAAIQLAKNVGANIIVTVGDKRKLEFLKSQGIEHIFHSRSLSYGKDIEALTKGKGVDVVLNSLSGEGFIETTLEIAKKGARFLEIGKRNIWTKEEMHSLRPDIDYHIIALDNIAQTNPEIIQAMLKELMPMFGQGILKPLKITRFPIENAIEAFEYMQTGKHIGKVVIELPEIKSFENLIRKNATYLITGGLGGLGLTLAKFLIEKGARNLVLTGRRELNDEIRLTLKNLEIRDAKISYESMDMGDEKSVSALLDRLQENEKTLKGIFHLAGALNDATLLDQDWNHFEKVFRPKVYGSFYLHHYSKNLDFFVMFSSLASSLGSPGQSNYAAANAFMDALCEYRKKQGLPAHSLSWGPWAEVGMAKALFSRHAKSGLIGLKPKEGMRALEIALLSNEAHISIANIHWKNYLKQLIAVPSWLEAFAPRKASQDNLLLQLEGVSANERHAVLKTYIADAVRSALGLSASQQIDENKGFFDMGLDSLMAIELKNRLQLGLGKSLVLSSTVVFDHPSIESMFDYLFKILGLGEFPSEKIADISYVPGDVDQAAIERSIETLDIDAIIKKIEGNDDK